MNNNLVIALQCKHASRGSQGGRNRTTRGRGAGAGDEAGAGTGAGIVAVAGATAKTGTGSPTMAEAKDLEPPIHYCWA